MEPNMLKELFEMQKYLQEALTGTILPEYRPDLTQYYAFGLFTELGEVFQADKSWKQWNVADKSVDKENIKEEIADCWLFIVNMTLAFGMDYDELHKAFKDKWTKVCEKNEV